MINILRSHTPIVTCILDALFPLYCTYCECPLKQYQKLNTPQTKNPFEERTLFRVYLESRLFCNNCLIKISEYKCYQHGELCNHCGSPLKNSRPCSCLGKINLSTERIRYRSIFMYSEEIRKLIFLLKFNPSIDLCNWVSLLFFTNLSELFQTHTGPSYTSWDSISFVPSKLNNVLKRGGYSTYWISKSLATLLGNIPILMVDTNSSLRQSSLKFNDRIKRGSRFEYDPILKCSDQKSTLLIDDMLTTGSSANQVAGVLINKGIKRVDILTLARAIDFKKNYLKLLEGCQLNSNCDT